MICRLFSLFLLLATIPLAHSAPSTCTHVSKDFIVCIGAKRCDDAFILQRNPYNRPPAVPVTILCSGPNLASCSVTTPNTTMLCLQEDKFMIIPDKPLKCKMGGDNTSLICVAPLIHSCNSVMGTTIPNGQKGILRCSATKILKGCDAGGGHTVECAASKNYRGSPFTCTQSGQGTINCNNTPNTLNNDTPQTPNNDSA